MFVRNMLGYGAFSKKSPTNLAVSAVTVGPVYRVCPYFSGAVRGWRTFGETGNLSLKLNFYMHVSHKEFGITVWLVDRRFLNVPKRNFNKSLERKYS